GDCNRILVDAAVRTGKKLVDLTEDDLRADRFGGVLLEQRPESLKRLTEAVRDRLLMRLERGAHTLRDTRFLHTEPHHDDIMLGYLPYVVRHVRDPSNVHCFATLTSGFTSVSNHFMRRQVELLEQFVGTPECTELMEEGYFEPDNEVAYNRDVWQYLDGVAANDERMRHEGVARRLLRNLVDIYAGDDLEDLENRIEELLHYFATQYPGSRDPEHVRKLKGMCREWEAECLWGYFGWSCANIHHLRLGFYTGEIFTEEPTVERDVAPVLRLLREVEPDVVTVALDPEASGPDTHYKVLQAVTEALKLYEQESGRDDIKVWGYRNVWYRFHPAEANIYVPISLNMFSIMDSAFHNAFASQRDASFPSWEHDGPFNELAQRIQVEQYQALKTCLGREWFHENPSPLIRATRGLAFLKEMTLPELYEHSRRLREAAESR
ncbi:MAG: glucosamine-6-phosphate deaminase, partial [Candidatus Brocadiia bacterium]